VLGFLDNGVKTSIMAGKEGEELQGCNFHRGLSIVRLEEKLCDVGGFPRLSPSHELHCPIPDQSDPLWDHHLTSSI
jgi:hypothetical protein